MEYTSDSIPDNLLLERFNRRDAKAFVSIYNHFFTELHAYAYHLYHQTSTLPEDAVQDVFCYLWESRQQTFNTLASLKSFLHVMLRNNYLHHLDHQKVEQKHKDLLERESRFSDTSWDSEVFIQLREYVERIPDPGNRVIKLYLDGYEAKDIAQEMQMNIQTIYNIKSKAISYLRKLFLGE